MPLWVVATAVVAGSLIVGFMVGYWRAGRAADKDFYRAEEDYMALLRERNEQDDEIWRLRQRLAYETEERNYERLQERRFGALFEETQNLKTVDQEDGTTWIHLEPVAGATSTTSSSTAADDTLVALPVFTRDTI